MHPKDPKDQPEEEYKDPMFPIAKEDIGPLLGGALMFVMTVAVVYYVYIGPSPFETWFSMLKAHDQAQSQTLPKPVQGMMPAEAVSAQAKAAAAAKGGDAHADAGKTSSPESAAPAVPPTVPEGSEAPETPEKAK